MKRRAAVVLVLALLLAGFVAVWPQLIADTSARRIGDWYPDSDPGVLLAIELQDRREHYGLGLFHHYHDVEFREDATTRSEVVVVEPGGGIVSRTSFASPVPTHTSAAHGSGGYGSHAAPHLARFAFDCRTQGRIERTLHRPIRIDGAAPTAGPADLAVAPDLDLHVRWHCTSTALQVELADPDRDGDSGCATALLRCGDAHAVPFAAAVSEPGLVAAVPLAGLAGWRGRDLNVRVDLSTDGTGARRVAITLQRP